MRLRPSTSADAPAWVALSNLILRRAVTVESFQAEEVRRDPAQLSRRWVVEDRGEVRGLTHLYFPVFLSLRPTGLPTRRDPRSAGGAGPGRRPGLVGRAGRGRA